MNKKRFYIHYNTVRFYLLLYFAAVSMLLCFIFVPCIKGEFNIVSLVVSLVLLIWFSYLLLKEKRSGIFDKIEIIENYLLILKFKKEIVLYSNIIKRIRVKKTMGSTKTKKIIINLNEENVYNISEIQIDYREKIYNILNEFYNE